MSFKIKGNDPLCEPPPFTSLLNETEKVPSLNIMGAERELRLELDQGMVECARKKLKQEPDRSTNQISEKRSPQKKKFRQKAPSRKERSVCKCGRAYFFIVLPVALSLETGGA